MKRERKLDNGYYSLRYKVLERDQFTCQCCGMGAPDTILQVDHIIPFSEGGETTESNLRATCFACNLGRSGLALSLQAKALAKKERKAQIAAGTYSYKYKHGSLSKSIIAHLEQEPMSVRELSELIGNSRHVIRTTMHRLKVKGKAHRLDDRWFLVD